MRENPNETAADFEGATTATLPPRSHAGSGQSALTGRDLVMRIPVTVQVVLGRLRMPVSELFKLGRGSVIALDRSIGEPVDLVVNGHLVARGEVVILDEKTRKFGVTLTEIVDSPGPV